MLDELPYEILSRIFYLVQRDHSDVEDPRIPTFPQDRILSKYAAVPIEPLSAVTRRLRQICIPELFEQVYLHYLAASSSRHDPDYDEALGLYKSLDRFNRMLKCLPASIIESIQYAFHFNACFCIDSLD